MKHVFIGIVIAAMFVSIVFAQTKNQTAVPSASETLADVRRAIDKGNRQWSEGWQKGDAAMVAAIFADDGVQLLGSGKILKGPQQIMERQKAAMQGADPGVKVTVITVNVWLDGDTAYETGIDRRLTSGPCPSKSTRRWRSRKIMFLSECSQDLRRHVR
jgi:uncharacterized protein (TIGR02246 family)